MKNYKTPRILYKRIVGLSLLIIYLVVDILLIFTFAKIKYFYSIILLPQSAEIILLVSILCFLDYKFILSYGCFFVKNGKIKDFDA
ncbi:hypothetical protein A2303_07595 [Candidatus Falkowbacteria bacterium RIFOXYB2_FULL_47_14]|uniref:Uncharacterized protein n=1 Tax=Candidatus Falkowbacteria bacterium RIFOXYA2_FULL_47_19 TaxID=1797994 RepID=A0A1F5SHA0_9BACT|nr:MAG: hypothetical protein A2227_01345 [Candidatus Falkowbacteria bacterium RIFOXYA2_FULL_47_19]OGF35003.1 MAG: hypothetical protein A2468_07300 [Candidatus Falkowbacteria bacterium RIFOXYC2_FULL_46_15]OGF43719.1 MAG: hypothetical protein A2303_07595 [Candidatus Falkowbacteria bacterium RIFOXYB2_FULL_47_14]